MSKIRLMAKPTFLPKGKTCYFQFSSNKIMVGRAGLEPATSRLSGVRSNHLSYRPMKWWSLAGSNR